MALSKPLIYMLPLFNVAYFICFHADLGLPLAIAARPRSSAMADRLRLSEVSACQSPASRAVRDLSSKFEG